MEWKSGISVNDLGYIFTLISAFLSNEADPQIQYIIATFSNHLRKSILNENINFCLNDNLFSKFSVSFWLPFLKNEKETDDSGNKIGFT